MKRMTTADFSNIAKAEDRFRYGVISDARKKLALKQQRKSGAGNSYVGRINTSSQLSQSLKSFRKNLDVTFSMKSYGYWVDQGRRAGKQPPTDAIEEWVRMKPIRPRDESGRFMAWTPSTMKGLAYVIARSIGKYGYKPTHFFTDAINQRLKTFYASIDDAIENDFNILFID